MHRFLILSVTIAAVAFAAEPDSIRTKSTMPAYFDDRAGQPVSPITQPLDLSQSDRLTIATPDGNLVILYTEIESVSFSPSGIGIAGRADVPFQLLLTIGFKVESVHHNLVVQLTTGGHAAVLKLLSGRTGLRIGTPKS